MHNLKAELQLGVFTRFYFSHRAFKNECENTLRGFKN